MIGMPRSKLVFDYGNEMMTTIEQTLPGYRSMPSNWVWAMDICEARGESRV